MTLTDKILILTGHGPIRPKRSASCGSFKEYLKTQKTDVWCLSNVSLQDDGFVLSQAIRNQDAIAISDGSYKDTFGTAAIILKGTTVLGRIEFSVIVPRDETVHSSYRSELAVIYSTLIMVNHLCRYFGVEEGSIEFACDGFTALTKVFHSTNIS